MCVPNLQRLERIFQDAAQNHDTTYGFARPMVFLGKNYWTEVKPVYPLWKQLAAGRDYERWLFISDDADAIVAHLRAFAAERAAGQ